MERRNMIASSAWITRKGGCIPEGQQTVARSRCPLSLQLARLFVRETFKCNVGHYGRHVSSRIGQLSNMHTMLRIPYVHPRAKLQCRAISGPFGRPTLIYHFVGKRKRNVVAERTSCPSTLINHLNVNRAFHTQRVIREINFHRNMHINLETVI